MMTQANEQALYRMIRNAESLGANAVLGIRVNTTCVMGSGIEVLVYGNAVVIDSDQGDPNPGDCSPS